MMSFRSSKKPKAMATTLFMFFLLFAVACGTTVQDTPVPPCRNYCAGSEAYADDFIHGTHEIDRSHGTYSNGRCR